MREETTQARLRHFSLRALVEIRVLPGFPVEAFGNDGLNKSQELNQKRL
jgi:hypothetical protein